LINASLPFPVLYGISAMGTKFAIYKYEKESTSVTPLLIPRDPSGRINDTAPEVWWEFELMEPAGEQAFRDVVAEIKSMALDLQNVSLVLQFSFDSILNRL
jgi:hypothetical protein